MFSDFGELVNHSCITGRSHLNWFYKPSFPLPNKHFAVPSGSDLRSPWKTRDPSARSASLSGTTNKRKAPQELHREVQLHRVC